MTKIPAPAPSGDCINVGGLTVCPHVVHLTKAQKRSVLAMHRKNVAKMKKIESAAIAKARKKKQT